MPRQLIDKDIINKPAIIGKNLKVLRISLEMTIEKAALLSGISKSFLSLVESGKRKIKTMQLRNLLSLYGYSLGRFLSEAAFDDDDRLDPDLVLNCRLELDSSDKKYKIILIDAIFQNETVQNINLYLSARSETPEFNMAKCRIKGIVMQGRLLIQFHDDEFDIGEGEDFDILISKPFIFRNYRKTDCVAHFSCFPPAF